MDSSTNSVTNIDQCSPKSCMAAITSIQDSNSSNIDIFVEVTLPPWTVLEFCVLAVLEVPHSITSISFPFVQWICCFSSWMIGCALSGSSNLNIGSSSWLTWYCFLNLWWFASGSLYSVNSHATEVENIFSWGFNAKCLTWCLASNFVPVLMDVFDSSTEFAINFDLDAFESLLVGITSVQEPNSSDFGVFWEFSCPPWLIVSFGNGTVSIAPSVIWYCRA